VPTGHGSPGWNIPNQRGDRPAFSEEIEVEGKTHAEGMDTAATRNQERNRLTAIEIGESEQAHTEAGREEHFAPKHMLCRQVAKTCRRIHRSTKARAALFAPPQKAEFVLTRPYGEKHEVSG